MSAEDVKELISNRAALVERALGLRLPPEGGEEHDLYRAMRYSTLGGGKRLRGVLALESAVAVGGTHDSALPAACALEMVHAYSLIHDDLPAMDDDDLRRGKPSCHKAFGEATAILAGDALLTLAFEVLAELPASPCAEAVKTLAGRAGAGGMVLGQALDIYFEGVSGGVDRASVESIHSAKTAALISAACECGAIAGGADDKSRAALASFGVKTGLAFQIADDLLDITADTPTLGKTAGKDRERMKATFPAVAGVDGAREAAQRFVTEGKKEIEFLGERGYLLQRLADYLIERSY